MNNAELVYTERDRALRLYGDALVTTGLELMMRQVTIDDFASLIERLRRSKLPSRLCDLERREVALKNAKDLLSEEDYAELIACIRTHPDGSEGK